MISLFLALTQILTPLGGEVDLTPEGGNQVCGSLSEDAGTVSIVYSGGNKSWARVVYGPMSHVGAPRGLDGSAPNTEDDTIAVGGMASASWRYHVHGWMTVVMRSLRFPSAPFYPFGFTNTFWQPDLLKRPNGRWLVAVTGLLNEDVLVVEVDESGPTSLVMNYTNHGSSQNWPTLAENDYAVWCAYRDHQGATSPDLKLLRINKTSLLLESSTEALRGPERPGDQTWPMLRSGSRGGLGLVYQDNHQGPRVEFQAYTPQGRKLGHIDLGDGRDPSVHALPRNHWLAVKRNGDLCVATMLSPTGVVLWQSSVNVTPMGPRPNSLTDRPWALVRGNEVWIVWTRDNGQRTQVGRRFRLVLP